MEPSIEIKKYNFTFLGLFTTLLLSVIPIFNNKPLMACLCCRFGVNSVTGMLTINPVAEEDDGEYRCVASNPAAKVERNLKLHVLVPPKVPLLLNITASTNNEAILSCRAKGRPLPSISFK